MRHTVSQAAILVGKNRRTLYRHIKSGRLSYEIGNDGNQLIDTSELIRVYGSVTLPETAVSQPVTEQMSQGETANVTTLVADLVAEVRGLSDQLAALKKELSERPRLEYTTVAPSSPKKPVIEHLRQQWAERDRVRAAFARKWGWD